MVLEALDRDYPDALFTVTLALPALLLGLPAGLLADRRDRRRLLMASHLLTGLFLLATAVLAAADVLSLPLVFLMAILTIGGLALGEPVRLALVPAVVPKERILNANALDHFGVLLGAAVGAGLQSAMLRFWGIEAAFVVMAIVVAMGAFFLRRLDLPSREPQQVTDGQEDSGDRSRPVPVRADIGAGFRFLWGSRPLRVMFLLMLVSVLIPPWLAVEMAGVWLEVELRARIFLTAMISVGWFLTAVVLSVVQRVPSAGLLFSVALIAFALLAVAVWASWIYGVTAALILLIGLTLGFRWILVLTVLQSHTPIAVIGRVMGIFVALLAAAQLLQPLIERVGVALLGSGGWTLLAAVVLAAGVALVVVRSPSLRRLPSHPEEPDDVLGSG